MVSNSISFQPGDAFFNENLRDRRRVQPGARNDAQCVGRVGNAAAGTAERERRADDDRVADRSSAMRMAVSTSSAMPDGINRLADGLHGVAEPLAVFGFVDGVNVGAEQAHTELRQRAVARQLHGEWSGPFGRPARPAGRPDCSFSMMRRTVSALSGSRYISSAICVVGHDRRRVGVDEHHVDPFVAQHAARLRAGVVELRRLTDHDRDRSR